jgi:hypothetical protein
MWAVHESDTAENVMPGRLNGRILDFESGYGRSANRFPGSHLIGNLEFPHRLMASWRRIRRAIQRQRQMDLRGGI